MLEALTNGPATPSTLESRTDLDIAHVSRSLSTMRDVELVELAAPEDTKKGRIHRITDHGEHAFDLIDDAGLG